MQSLRIVPFEQVGVLRFGMTRQESREVLNDEWHSFLKGPKSVVATDAYDKLGLHLYFGDSECLECVDVFSPNGVVYEGVELVGRDVHDVARELTTAGCSCRSDDGIFCDEQGFALFAPDGIVLAVTIYARGYEM